MFPLWMIQWCLFKNPRSLFISLFCFILFVSLSILIIFAVPKSSYLDIFVLICWLLLCLLKVSLTDEHNLCIHKNLMEL